MRTRLLASLSIYVCLASLASGVATAKPAFFATLISTYPAHSSALQDRACLNCHTTNGDPGRNVYGKELESLIKKSGGQDLTSAILKQAESASPAVGSATFGTLINTDKDLTTVEPSTVSTAVSSQSKATSETAPPVTHSIPAAQPLIPANFMHPAIVHFPIALFICGLFLDAVGFIRKDKNLLMAGWYDLILAAVSSLAAVATGLGALIRMSLPLSGIILIHMLLALVTTVLMWTLVGLRAYKHERLSTPGRVAYYIIAAANLVIIAVVGHLGGQFVYGG